MADDIPLPGLPGYPWVFKTAFGFGHCTLQLTGDDPANRPDSIPSDRLRAAMPVATAAGGRALKTAAAGPSVDFTPLSWA